jgi:hypothetical protein
MCLAIYLIVLVPLNWLVFQALGRIEWAWIAAPVVALAGTIAVVRQAQLDIGFVRSQTEISLLELQGAHNRAYLSRYMALYSSLSTTYNAEFADATAVATPFPAERLANSSRPLIGESTTTVEFEKYDQPRLRGIPVTSASTQFLHAEEMYPLAGSLRLSSPSTNPNALQLENKSGLNLADAVVMRRNRRGDRWTYQGCWLGEFANGSSQLLPMTDILPQKGQLAFAAQRAEAAKIDSHKRLNVDPLIKLAFQFAPVDDPLYGQRDEYRLVARIDEPLPGAVTTPAASQTTGTTVVLAHLRYSLPPPRGPDANSAKDVVGDRRNAYDEEPAEAPDVNSFP